MSIFDKLTTDMKTAMKAGEKDRLSTIRLLRGYIKNEEINRNEKLTEEEEIAVLSSAAKKRKESIEAYQKADRQDLVEKERKELEIIQSYLPQPLSDDEVQKIVKDAIRETGAQTMKDIGKVMSIVMEQVKGRADGKKVNEIVRKKLSL